MPLLQEVEITSSLPSLSFNLLSHLVFFFSHLDTDKIQQHWIFVLRSKLSGVNSPGRHWKDFLCIENLWTRRDAGFSNLALKGIQTFCSWSKHITRWNGAVYIWAVWGCTADMCVHWKGKRGIKFRCPVHANSLPRFILTSRKKKCNSGILWPERLMTGVPVTELFLHGAGNGTNYFEQVYQKKCIVFHAHALQVFNLKLRLIRLLRVLFPCIYIISKGSLPPPVCVHTCVPWVFQSPSFYLFNLDSRLQFTCLLTSRYWQLWPTSFLKACRHARRHINWEQAGSPALLCGDVREAAESLIFPSSSLLSLLEKRRY